MAIHKVTEVFVGGGSALDANNTSISAVASQLAIVGSDMTCLNPGGGDTITTQPSIYICNKYSDGTNLKRSFEIKGTNVVSYQAERYSPSKREVWAIGYDRVLATGSIDVNNSTLYKASIRFKWDKSFYSERPEVLSISFISSGSATQSNIADQIVNAINNSAFGPTPNGVATSSTAVIKAKKVGDGTGASGLTSASNYGVEIWGLTPNQFTTSTYKPVVVYFSVHVDDSTGFDTTTTCTQIQGADPGVGTYLQAYNMENFAYGDEGVLNRVKWPIPSLTLLASSTLVDSANVAAASTSPTGNVSAVAVGDDVITVATATTGLRAGEFISINSVNYEILYILSSTKFVLTSPATAVYAGGAALKVRYKYAVVNITVRDFSYGDGSQWTSSTDKSLVIFTPQIDSGAADPFDTTGDSADTSAEGLDIMDILNGWMTTTPLAPANINI